MEKPPVLSECICEMYDFKPFYSPWDVNNTKLNHCYECDAYNKGREHQRDKDVEWYEKKRIEWTRMDRDWLRIVKGWRRPEAVNTLIQQARQDTAREIFKYVKRLKNPHDYKKHFLSYIEFWRAKRHILGKLKTKYLIPPNPVGAGDV